MRRGITLGLGTACALAVILMVVTGNSWRVVAYVLVALFAFLVLEALYFWGSMVLGTTVEALSYRRSARWSIGAASLAVPEHDIDPGLELMSAGMLVYRLGEVKPHPFFRNVSLTNARAIRPFVVARTGDPRRCHFVFTLLDEAEQPRVTDEFEFDLGDDPQIVMPGRRLLLDMPRKFVGQRWSLRVQSGVTMLTTFRFMFVEDGRGVPASNGGALASGNGGELSPGRQTALLPQLLDEAIKRDALALTPESVLEDR